MARDLRRAEHALSRGAKIHAELAGYGATGDAYHITTPPQKARVPPAMLAALKDAGLSIEDVDYINAHGLPPSTMTSSKQWL